LDDGNCICFNSLPRSGNTFLRKYLELLTGVTTGNHMPKFLDKGWTFSGLIGQGVIDNRVFISKNHYPGPSTLTGVKANKMIEIVRNPYD
jgi:lipid-binding SYLF domain-containing protein